MEQMITDSNTINNNVIDDLDALKENQMNTLENVKIANQIDNLIEKKIDDSNDSKPDNVTDNQSNNHDSIDNQHKDHDKITAEQLLDSTDVQPKKDDQLVDDLLNNDSQIENNKESNIINLDEVKGINDNIVKEEIEKEIETEEKSEEINKQETDATNELVCKLIDQPIKTSEQQVDELVSDLIESPKQNEETCELTKDLIEGPNDTADHNSLNLTKNENDLHETIEDSIEQPRDSAMSSVINDNLIEDCSVKETQFIDLTQNVTTDSYGNFTQDITPITLDSNLIDTKQEHQNLTTATTKLDDNVQENLLEQPILANDSKLENDQSIIDLNQTSDQSIDKSTDKLDDQNKINLDNQPAKEISLIDISNDSLIKEQEKLLNTTLENDNQIQPSESNTSCQESSSVQLKTEKSDFFSDLNKELNKSVEAFLTDIKPNEPEEKKLEDFVTENVENESNNDNRRDSVAKSETFIVHKSADQSEEQNDQPNEEESVKNDDEIKSKDQVKREDSVNLEEVIRTTKTELFNQSQEYLKKADQLIAEKKSQINEVNIPGLDIKLAAEQKDVCLLSDKPDELINQESTNQESNNQTTQNQPSENIPTKSKQKTRNCILI